MSTRDSSLRSEWHSGAFCHCIKVLPLGLSFWTSFWARKNPYGLVRVGLGQLSWFVILNALFGRGRISAMLVKVWVVKILSPFKHDSSNEYAGFFTAFRMTFWGVLSLYKSPSPWFVILNELLGEEESLQRVVRQSSENVIEFYLWFVQWVRGILHCVQNDKPREFFAILKGLFNLKTGLSSVCRYFFAG